MSQRDELVRLLQARAPACARTGIHMTTLRGVCQLCGKYIPCGNHS